MAKIFSRCFKLSFLIINLFCSFVFGVDDKPKTSLTFEMKPTGGGYAFLIEDGATKDQFELPVQGNHFGNPTNGSLPGYAKLQGDGVEFEVQGNSKMKCRIKCDASGEAVFCGPLVRDSLEIKVPVFKVNKCFIFSDADLLIERNFIAQQAIIKGRNLKISSPNKSVIELSNARIDCENLQINLVKGELKLICGIILSNTKLFVSVNSLTLSRENEIEMPAPGKWDCSLEKSNPSMLMSQSDMEINANVIKNAKSIIYAQKNMKVSFKTLSNIAGRPQQRRWLTRHWMTCFSKSYDISFDTFPIQKPDEKAWVCYTTALFWAGNSLEMVINGEKFTLKGQYRGGLPGIVNTGVLGSSGMLDVNAGDIQSNLSNGLAHGMPLAWSASGFGDIISYEMFPATIKNDSLFFYKILSNQNKTKYKPSDFPVYFNNELKNQEIRSIISVHQFLMSPPMESESACISIGERTGHILLPDESNCSDQLEDLKQEGILFGQVNGDLIPKNENIQTSTCEEVHSRQVWDSLLDDEKRVFENIAQQYRVDESRSGFNLFHNKRLHETGNYWMILTGFNVNHKPKVSFFYQQYPFDPSCRHHPIECKPTYLLPAIYIAEKDYSNFHPEAAIKADEAHIHGSNLDVFNTGSIITAKQLKIEAKSFVNERLMQEKQQTVQQGFSGTKTYSIRVPQENTGVVLGLDIDIKTDQDTVNRGGKINATHNVKLVSANGNVVNTFVLSEFVVQWDPGFWGKVLGKENSSKAATFVEGQISAGNDVELLAQAGLAINLASIIEAGNNATIDGFLGVLTQDCAYKYVAEDSTKFTGLLTVKSVMREVANVGMSRIIAKHGDVTMQSKAGKVTNIGTYVDAGGNIHYKGEKGNVIKPFTVQTKWHESTFGINSDGFLYEDTKGTNTDQTSSLNKAGQSINVVTTEDNDLEFEDMIAGERIVFKAGKKNNIKGVTRCYETDTTQTSLRLNTFGIPILKSLFNDGFAASLQQFAASDPLVASFIATISSERLSQLGYRGVLTAAEFIKLIDNLVSNSVHAKSIKALIAQRLGLSSDGVSFSPALNLRLGLMNQKQALCITQQPTLNAKGVEIDGEQSSLEGVKFVNTEEITLNSKEDLSFTPGNAMSNQTSSTEAGASITYVPGVGITGAGIDGSVGSGLAEEHPHIPMRAKKTTIIVGRNMQALNYLFGGEIVTNDPQVQDKRSNVTIIVGKDCTIGTLPDKSYYKQYHGAIFAGFDGQSGTVGAGTAGSDKIAVIAQGGIAAGTKFKLTVTGKLTLNGALIDGEGEIEADELEVNDIYLKDNANAQEFGVSYQGSSALNSQETFTFDKVKKEGVIHSVIGPKITLNIHKGIPANLRRNINEAREDFKPEESHLAFAFFTPNFERMREIGNEWRQMRDDAKNRARLKREKQKAEENVESFLDAHEDEAVKQEINEVQNKQTSATEKPDHKAPIRKKKEQVIDEIVSTSSSLQSDEMSTKLNFGFDVKEQIQLDFGSKLNGNLPNGDPHDFEFSTSLKSVSKSGKVEFILTNKLGHKVNGLTNVDSLIATAIKIDNLQRGLPIDLKPINPAFATVDWALGKMINLVNDWGGIAGAAIGGTVGAGLGAVGGTLVPGAGTLSGMVGGGIVGARYGAVIGDSLALILMGIRVGLGYDAVNHRSLSGQERLQEGVLVTATTTLLHGARKLPSYLKDFKVTGYVSDLYYRVKDGVVSFIDSAKQTIVTSANRATKTFNNWLEKNFGRCIAREAYFSPFGNGQKTGTVWDFIKPTQPLYEGTTIPRSFEITVGDKKIWVHGNGSKHLDESIRGMMEKGVPDIRLYSQNLLLDFQGALKKSLANGIEYDKLIVIDKWEFIFGKAQSSDKLPVLYHAQFGGWK